MTELDGGLRPYSDRMTGKTLGYVRISSVDQNLERQLEGLNLNKTFTDKASGKDAKRPQLLALLDYARDGDTVLVHSMDRLARNLDDLRRIVQTLTAKGVQVQFLKEGLTFTGEDSAMSQLLLSVMGAFAEFERALIRERQREGIALAKKKGVYKGRKKVLRCGADTEAAATRPGGGIEVGPGAGARHQPGDPLPLPRFNRRRRPEGRLDSFNIAGYSPNVKFMHRVQDSELFPFDLQSTS